MRDGLGTVTPKRGWRVSACAYTTRCELISVDLRSDTAIIWEGHVTLVDGCGLCSFSVIFGHDLQTGLQGVGEEGLGVAGLHHGEHRPHRHLATGPVDSRGKLVWPRRQEVPGASQ